jgi:hypothetical protein
MRGRPAGDTFNTLMSNEGDDVINRKTLIGLAVATFTLLLASAAIGSDNDVLWIVDDIVWVGFLACALALIVLSVGVLLRSLTRSRRARSSSV